MQDKSNTTWVFFKKFKFWRKRRDVGAKFQKRIEELERMLAILATTEESVKQQNSKSDQVEATLHGGICELEENLQGSDHVGEEVEATLSDQIKVLEHPTSIPTALFRAQLSHTSRRTALFAATKEMEREGTDAEVIKECDKLQGSEANSKHAEAAFLGQIEELGNKEKLEANLSEHINKLEKKLQERYVEKEQLETALQGQIKKLKKKLMEEASDRATIEVKLNRKIRELKEEIQEADSLKNEAESILRGQTECYKRKLKEKDALREQVEVALYDTSKELEERVRGSRVFEEVFHRMCEGYENRIIKANLEKDRVISRMEGLEKEV
jgi:chromosome segregation ATPase